MAYVKKISNKQFLLDCINKEHEIAGSKLHWDNFDDLEKYVNTHDFWYNDYSFTTAEQYKEMKEYFLEHFYDWKPKRYSIEDAKKEFSWFMFMYGLRYDFDSTQLLNL